LGAAQARWGQLEVIAKNSSLTACFLDRNLHVSDRDRELLPHFASDLAGNVLCQQLSARVGNRQKDDVAAGQEKPLLFVEYFHFPRIFSHLNRRTVPLYQGPMIERIADLFDQGLESDEVQNDARGIQFTFHGNRNLIIVSVQRLPSAVSKDQKVGRREVEVVFCDFDAKAT